MIQNRYLLKKLLHKFKYFCNSFFVLLIFIRYTAAQIGKKYGRSRSTANYWKLAALKQLRKEMERLEHEEQEADTF